jgi:intracellular multiplication protein IcmG
MAQDTYDNDSTEYQLNDEDEVVYDNANKQGVTGTGQGSGDMGGKKGSGIKRLIVFVVLAAIIIFILYEASSFIFGTKSKKTAKTTTQTQQVSIPAVKVQQQTTPPAVKEDKTADNAAQQHQELQSSLDQASKSTQAIVGQITQLTTNNQKVMSQLQHQQYENQSQLSALTNKMANIQQQINNLQDSIQGVSALVKTNQVSQTTLDAYRTQLQSYQKTDIQTKKRYFVQAVIPGRAWLQAQDGSSITITVGDVIPGYGKVVSINPYSGTVITDSGEKINYGVSSA